MATASKYCSAYGGEHCGDRNAQTPGAIKCLGPGELLLAQAGVREGVSEGRVSVQQQERLKYR